MYNLSKITQALTQKASQNCKAIAICFILKNLKTKIRCDFKCVRKIQTPARKRTSVVRKTWRWRTSKCVKCLCAQLQFFSRLHFKLCERGRKPRWCHCPPNASPRSFYTNFKHLKRNDTLPVRLIRYLSISSLVLKC